MPQPPSTSDAKPRTLDLSTAGPETPLTERQTAEEIIGVAPITLTQWRHAGKAPPHFKAGRAIRYRLADVLAWRDARVEGKRT